jgi:hypothetical protein
MPVTLHAIKRFQDRVAPVSKEEAISLLDPLARDLPSYDWVYKARGTYAGQPFIAVVRQKAVITVYPEEVKKPNPRVKTYQKIRAHARWKWWE